MAPPSAYLRSRCLFQQHHRTPLVGHVSAEGIGARSCSGILVFREAFPGLGYEGGQVFFMGGKEVHLHTSC